MIINTLYYKYGVKSIVIDYLQKIETNEQQMRHSIRKIVNKLSSACNNLIIPITLISELRRSDKPPTLSDMMESSAFEYAADVVGLLWQPASSEYQLDEVQTKSDGNISTENLVIMEQVKGRNTGVARYYYDFIGEEMRFKNKKLHNIPF